MTAISEQIYLRLQSSVDKQSFIEYYPPSEKFEAMYVLVSHSYQDVFSEEDFIKLFSNELEGYKVSVNRPNSKLYGSFDIVYILLKPSKDAFYKLAFDYTDLISFLQDVNPQVAVFVDAHLTLQ